MFTGIIFSSRMIPVIFLVVRKGFVMRKAIKKTVSFLIIAGAVVLLASCGAAKAANEDSKTVNHTSISASSSGASADKDKEDDKKADDTKSSSSDSNTSASDSSVSVSSDDSKTSVVKEHKEYVPTLERSGNFEGIPTEGYDGDFDLHFYTMGEDKMLMVIRGDLCADIAPKTTYGTKEVAVNFEDGSVWTLTNVDSHGLLFVDFTELFFFASYHNNGCNCASPNLYFTLIDEEGIVNKIKKDEGYIITYRDLDGEKTDGVCLKEGILSDLIETDMTEEKYLKIYEEAFEDYVDPFPAKGPWDGIYAIRESMAGNQGHVMAEVMSGGLIKFDVDITGYKGVFYARETNLVNDTVNGYVSAGTQLMNFNNEGENLVAFSYEQDTNGSIKLYVTIKIFGEEDSVDLDEVLCLEIA